MNPQANMKTTLNNEFSETREWRRFQLVELNCSTIELAPTKFHRLKPAPPEPAPPLHLMLSWFNKKQFSSIATGSGV
jgi:hypothetical protein